MANILHVYRTYYPDPQGGLQEAIRQIALASKAYGHEPKVYTLSPNPLPKQINVDDIPVLRSLSWAAPASCDLGGLSSLSTFFKAAEWADIIHYHFPWPFADLLESIIRPKRIKVMTYHSDIVRQSLLKSFYSPLMHHMLSKMDAIVATSPVYAQTSKLLKDSRYSSKVQTIPLGIDERLYSKGNDIDIFTSLGVQPDRPYFLFVGVLRYYKGLNFLIDAASYVNAPIVIAGIGSEYNRLKIQVKELGLSNVIFAGQVSNIQKAALIKKCRALILPSHLRSEAFGMVLVEAGMYGRPMISTEIGSGTSFVNIDGETGLVIPPRNSAEMAIAMNILLTNEQLFAKFCNASRRRYEDFFSGDALGASYNKLYLKVLKGK